jgi:hypothetical protein
LAAVTSTEKGQAGPVADNVDLASGLAAVDRAGAGQIAPFRHTTPKSRAGERILFLDDATNDGIKALHTQQAKNRLRLGPAYRHNDLIFCREDGNRS